MASNYGIKGTFAEKSRVLLQMLQEEESQSPETLKMKDILKAGMRRSKRVGEDAITHEELVAQYVKSQKNEMFAKDDGRALITAYTDTDNMIVV